MPCAAISSLNCNNYILYYRGRPIRPHHASCASVCPTVLYARSPRQPHNSKQESRAVARKPRDAGHNCTFWFKVRRNIHYKFKSRHASKARQASEHTYTHYLLPKYKQYNIIPGNNGRLQRGKWTQLAFSLAH